MDNGDEQPDHPSRPPTAPTAFQLSANWSQAIAAMATSVYNQIFAQVHENLIQAFSTEVQRLKDSNTVIAAAYTAWDRGDRGTDHIRRPQRSVMVIGNAVQFETFASDVMKILWSQGFLTGTAAMWLSNITHSQSFTPARYNFDLWITGFHTMFCSCNCAADARKALHYLSMGNQLILVYCNKAKAIILDLAPGDRGSNLVLDRFKAGLLVVVATCLLNMQLKYTNIDETLKYLLANEQDFIELNHWLTTSHRAAALCYDVYS
ncbi:hypothetical protein FIBSPDRAFT_969506 [Athelia psychrophila]|uniref:Uncharacterized protein n=1 Tax=Athelia psychrophila TaxID=1759441 RepID=A0A167TG01_9AGAM|nr:hypothetical protein FIBSPDRAFT_969506 [Fibularhizoctonia sp. CBS 109695]